MLDRRHRLLELASVPCLDRIVAAASHNQSSVCADVQTTCPCIRLVCVSDLSCRSAPWAFAGPHGQRAIQSSGHKNVVTALHRCSPCDCGDSRPAGRTSNPRFVYYNVLLRTWVVDIPYPQRAVRSGRHTQVAICRMPGSRRHFRNVTFCVMHIP